MTEVRFKAEIKSLLVKEDTLKLTLEVPIDDSVFHLIPLRNKQLSFSATDNQSELPLEFE